MTPKDTATTPNSAMTTLLRWHHWLIAMIASLGTAWIFVLMFLICADVVGLKLFSRPLYGVVEFTEASIVPIVFLQLAGALHHGRLTRADFLFAGFARRAPGGAALLDTLFMLAGALVFAALSVQLFEQFTKAYASADYIGSKAIFTLPVWPFALLTFIGAAATAVEFAATLIRKLGETAAHGLRLPETLVVLAVAGVVVALIAFILVADPGRLVIGGLVIAVLLLLLMTGMPVALVLMLVGIGGIWLLRDNPTVAMRALKTAATGTINKFDFGVVPLFVLMGLFTDISDIGRDAYRVAAWWTRKLLGGLGIATVAANAIFAAVTGISIASAAIFSRLAVPQMVEHGYTRRFAAGTVAGTSVLGMLIPPSLLLIIYGFVAEASVGQLFVAAFIPGALLAALFCLTILLLARFAPEFVGAPEANDDLEPETLVSSARRLFPIAIMVSIVLGGIYLGWFTPTQAGAVGAFVAMIVTLARRRLTRETLWRVLQDTGQITVTVLVLVIGASVLSKALVMSSLPMQTVSYVTSAGYGFWGIVVLTLLIAIVMGMFLDSTSIIVILVPIVLPLITSLGTPVIGADVTIWFGILIIIAVEMGLLTPPFGISVFVVTATIGNGCKLGEVFAGAFPYVLTMAVLIGLIMAFPGLVTAVL